MAADYASLRERHAAKSDGRALLPFAEARATRSPIDWEGYRPPRPRMLAQQARDMHEGPTFDHRDGALAQYVRTFHDYPLGDLREYIDWQPFFSSWEMKGRFPDILNNPPPARRPAGSGTTRRRCSTR